MSLQDSCPCHNNRLQLYHDTRLVSSTTRVCRSDLASVLWNIRRRNHRYKHQQDSRLRKRQCVLDTTRSEPEQQEEARAPTPVLEIPEIVEPVRQNVRQQQTPNLRDTPRTNIPRMPWRHMERQNTSPMKVVYREAKQEHQVNLKLSAFTPAQADIWVDMVKDSFLIHRLKI